MTEKTFKPAKTLDTSEQAKSLGCEGLVEDAAACGADEADRAVAMDTLEAEGWDACVAFLSKATNGRYPPSSGLLPRKVPEKYLVDQRHMQDDPRRRVWWDCVTFGRGVPMQPYERLFGNANVGYLFASNMQVAGQFGPDDGASYVGGWSVQHNAQSPELRTAVDNYMMSAVATFTLGDRNVADRHLMALQKEAKPIEVLVPCRQNVCVNVQSFDNHHEALDQMVAEGNYGQSRLNVWIVFEGWSWRETRYRQRAHREPVDTTVTICPECQSSHMTPFSDNPNRYECSNCHYWIERA